MKWYDNRFPFGFWTYVFSRIERWMLKRQGVTFATTSTADIDKVIKSSQ